MPNPVKLATKNFKTQKEAIAFFKPMLYRQKVGEKVNEKKEKINPKTYL